MSVNRPGGISPLLKYAPAGTYVTVEQLPHGGSLQARMLSTQAVQLYWRYFTWTAAPFASPSASTTRRHRGDGADAARIQPGRRA
jgi:hypothetical protein